MSILCLNCCNKVAANETLCASCELLGGRSIPKNDISDNLYTFYRAPERARSAAKDTKMTLKNELSVQKFDEIIENHLRRAHELAGELENLSQALGGRATEHEMAAMGARLTACAADDFHETQKALAELRTIFLHGDIFSELMDKFDDS